MRIILMVNAIIDRSYSSESSKKHPFSLRATFTAEKVRLEQEVLNQTDYPDQDDWKHLLQRRRWQCQRHRTHNYTCVCVCEKERALFVCGF